MNIRRRIAFVVARSSLAAIALSGWAAAQTLITGPDGHLYGITPGGSWTDAEAYAVSLGGHLVTIDDAAENEFIRTTFLVGASSSEDFWIGLLSPTGDWTDSTTWLWASGDASTYRNWRPGQPDYGLNDGEDDRYATINFVGGSNGQWDNYPNSAFRQPRGIFELVPPVVPTLITGPDGHLYGITPAGSWTDAEAYAVSQGGHLVTIDDAAENDFIRDTFLVGISSSEDFWIGLLSPTGDWTDTSTWSWVSGAASTYRNWRPGQPDYGLNDGEDDRYAAINFVGGADGQWDNYPDSVFRQPRGIFEVVSDADGDGLLDEDEALHGTDPSVADTDGDGLSDGDEVHTYGTSPILADSDADGYPDGAEVAAQQFAGCPDPLLADTDLDGISDGDELALGLDPCDADFDDDGLTDGQEIAVYFTNPFVGDTDGDGLLDGTEVDIAGTGGCPSPLLADSDGDGLSDGDETDDQVGSPEVTDPCNSDTDGDSIPDGIDPAPTDPEGTEVFVAMDLRDLGGYVASIDSVVFDAPNGNGKKGRRAALANKLSAAANAVAAGDAQGAIDQLNSLLKKLDGNPQPSDWMLPGPEVVTVVASIQDALTLLGYL